jgi:hypothetical protein
VKKLEESAFMGEDELKANFEDLPLKRLKLVFSFDDASNKNDLTKLKRAAKAKPIHWITLVFPIFAALVLFWLGFKTDVEKMLTLFLPIIWGIMFSLGGGLVFLKRYKFDRLSDGRFKEKLSRHVMTFSVILMFHTLLFLIASSFYPAKGFFFELSGPIGWLSIHRESLCRAYQGFLFSLILLPSIASILVGAWALYLIMNENHLHKKRHGLP